MKLEDKVQRKIEQEDKTIYFFQEISKIPRESGNEKAISNYLCEFAKRRDLFFIQDSYYNVIIKKKMLETKQPIILQAHIDMVCEKEEGKKFDFGKDGIQICSDGKYLKANGTTLGADNGIGVAQILNILDSDLPCNIEAVFTVSEETSMCGALNLDTSCLQGKCLLNLDGFEANTIILESASFYDIIFITNFLFSHKRQGKTQYHIEIVGLPGGHSGFDIDKNRGNAIVLLANFLEQIEDIEISDFVGGTKFNVIPSHAEAEFSTSLTEDDILKRMRSFESKYKTVFKDICMRIKIIEEKDSFLTVQDSHIFLQSILVFQHGVWYMNKMGQPITSVNLGVVNLKTNEWKIGMRSSRKDEEKQCLMKLEEYCQNNRMNFQIIGMQPGFQTEKNSKMIQKLRQAYQKSHKREPKLQSVHITVEAGIIKEKMPDIEIAIISPNIKGAHTPYECVEIESIIQTDKWLHQFLLDF